MIEDLQFFVTLASLGASAAALITAGLVYHQIRHTKRSYEVDLTLRLTEHFHRDKNMQKISTAITFDQPILKDNGGKTDEDDLIEYLGIFVDVMRFVDMGVLTIETVDDLFWAYVEDLIDNKEIKEYIKEVQKDQGEDAWSGIKALYEELKKLNS